MTSDEFGEVDIDLLADYIGGALDGPGEAEVARLIDEDPRWREAHDLLAPRDGRGRRRAHRAGCRARADAGRPGVPAGSVVRFADRLADDHRPGVWPSRAEPHRRAVIRAGTWSSVPGTGVDRPARRRKRLRWAAPIAVAAGVLAFAGFGADYLAGQSEHRRGLGVAGRRQRGERRAR